MGSSRRGETMADESPKAQVSGGNATAVFQRVERCVAASSCSGRRIACELIVCSRHGCLYGTVDLSPTVEASPRRSSQLAPRYDAKTIQYPSRTSTGPLPFCPAQHRLRTRLRQGYGVAGASTNPAIAFPLHLGHFARHNINRKGAIMADAGSFSLDGNFIVSGCQQRPKVSLVISGE
jgi:hypothetical protein